MPRTVAIAIWLLLFLMSFTCAQAATGHNAGFRTFGVWQQEPPARLDLNVWYPSPRQEQVLTYLAWDVSGAANGRPAEGKFPLIIISHDTAGSRFAHHDLAEYLARRGFVVVAPNHARDNLENMDDLFTWEQLENRAKEIGVALEFILKDNDLGQIIDRERIGIAGFGAGGTVALLLGGALPDCTVWDYYCSGTSGVDSWCAKAIRGKINDICGHFPLKASLANTNIKAVAAIAPAYAMLFGKDSLKYFYPPILLAGGEEKESDITARLAEQLKSGMGKNAQYLQLPDTAAGTLMSECPPALKTELPDLCLSVSSEERKKIHGLLASSLLSFYRTYLAADTVPAIPNPPDLSPAIPAANNEKIKGKRRGGK